MITLGHIFGIGFAVGWLTLWTIFAMISIITNERRNSKFKKYLIHINKLNEFERWQNND